MPTQDVLGKFRTIRYQLRSTSKSDRLLLRRIGRAVANASGPYLFFLVSRYAPTSGIARWRHGGTNEMC